MAVDVSQLIEYVVDAAPEETGTDAESAQPYLAIAIFDGTQWASLCPDVDVASCGSTADEALMAVQAAVADVIAAATEAGLHVKGRVSDDDLRDFMLAHKGPMGIVGRNFIA